MKLLRNLWRRFEDLVTGADIVRRNAEVERQYQEVKAIVDKVIRDTEESNRRLDEIIADLDRQT